MKKFLINPRGSNCHKKNVQVTRYFGFLQKKRVIDKDDRWYFQNVNIHFFAAKHQIRWKTNIRKHAFVNELES